MNSKNFFLKLMCAALFFAAFGASQISAQPTDAQLKKLLSGPKVISSQIHKPGKKVWSPSYSKYTWDIGFTNRVKDSDNPGLIIVVKGIMSFDIIGGRYVYWRDFLGESSYEGIPNPTEADFQELVKQFGINEILGNRAKYVVGKVESIKLAKEPKYEWHTPNSVSFRFTAIYTAEIDSTGKFARMEVTFVTRLYRDTLKGAWKGVSTDYIDEQIL